MRSPIPLYLCLLACGGPRAQDPSALLTPADAGSAAQTPSATPLTGARMPPPFQLDSKHIERKQADVPAPCRAQEQDAKATIASMAQACGLKAEGAAFNGQQSPTQASASFDLKGAKGQCVRIAATAGPGVKSLVVTLMDAAGAIAAEYHTDDVRPVVLPEESLCFKDDAVLKVSASVGSGSGAFSVQALKE